ncbi:MAG: hotdog fold thioesterase [Flavobacteriales bacterium]
MDKSQVLAAMNAGNKNTLMEALGIEFTDAHDGYVEAKMPVDVRTHQPMGLLHGGATAALAETLGSVGSHMLIDRNTQATVGIEVNANHLKGARSGWVIGKAQIQHEGRKLHVWNIEVFDEADRKIAVCRLTNMIIDKK